MYAGGSAGTNSTYRANLRAFEKFRIIPRMLVDASVRNLEVRRSHRTVILCIIVLTDTSTLDNYIWRQVSLSCIHGTYRCAGNIQCRG